MTSTSIQTYMPFAGSRLKTCCGKLAGCACRRPAIGNVNGPTHFSGNFSPSPNGRIFHTFRKCGKLSCKVKCTENRMVLPSNNICSNVNNRGFVILTDSDLDCGSSNVVYLVTCRICRLQYVGETSRAANVRWQEHMYKIRKGDKSQLIYSHFDCDDAHRNTPVEDRIRFQIIEKIKCDDLPSADSVSIRKRRVERELYWISKLRTVFPLGLNDKVSGFGLHGNVTDSRFTDYNLYRIVNICDNSRRGRKHRHCKKRRKRAQDGDYELFRDCLSTLSDTNFSSVEREIYSKNRKFLEGFYTSRFFGPLPRRIRYLIAAKVNFSRKVGPVKKEMDSILWNVRFSHSIIGDMNLGSILNSVAVTGNLPSDIKRRFTIRPWYKYSKTIGNRILNYNKILKSCGNMSYDDIMSMNCDCQQSEFNHGEFDHVITGDLGIIQCSELCKICSYGTKFRENPPLDINFIKAQLKDEVGKLTAKVSQKYRKSRLALKKWGGSLFQNLVSKLMSCKDSGTYTRSVLSRVECKQELDRLQDKYVITVVDKAAGNFGFTCKKFYFMKLAAELGLNNENPGNETYEFSQENEVQIVDKARSDLLRFNIEPEGKESKLALLYQNPKFHKNPPKMRYIAGNVGTVTTKLDKIVALTLKMCKSHFQNLCNKNMEFSGIRYCFDVQTSAEVKAMFELASGSARSISINDFSTLYTLFEHDHLIHNITWLLGKLSKNSGMHYVRIGHDKAWWVRNNAEGVVYSVGELIEMIDYLVRNTYIKAFGSIFRQSKGIIMGGKSSGWLSDCSLMVDEYKYVDSKVKAGNLDEANILKYFRRYRDDCTSLNIQDFLVIAGQIYPPSLSLTQENRDSLGADVLDMNVEINDGYIRTKVYCKADAFPFRVVTMPFLESNLDKGVCYRVFYGQVVRFQRLCTYKTDFELRTRHLLGLLRDRGYQVGLLGRQFCRAVDKYISDFQRWELPTDIMGWFRSFID